MAWLPYACGSDESTRQNERNATGIRENGTCKVFLLKLKSEFSHLEVIFDYISREPQFFRVILEGTKDINTESHHYLYGVGRRVLGLGSKRYLMLIPMV